MRYLIQFTAVLAFSFSLSVAAAQNKVVVIPLGKSKPKVEVPVVTSAGQTWMALNLGASQVATSSADPAAYGTLYQWGRFGDGHEYRSSLTTTELSNTDAPGHGSFIKSTFPPYDWRTKQNDNLWQGESGINNPCPPGFRLPTDTELNTERLSWSSNDSVGALASPLKLVPAGYRNGYTGGIEQVGTFGFYWSSTVNDQLKMSGYLIVNFIDSYTSYTRRSSGFSVRCIKD
jgi:hypothetical protein